MYRARNTPMSERTLSRKKNRESRRFVAGRFLADLLEPRQMMSIVTLSTGTGPGGTKVAVDGYGAFGLTPTGVATQYEDFTVGATGIVDKSYVYFTPLRSFLAENEFTTASYGSNPIDLPEPTVVGQTGNLYTTTFNLKGADAGGVPFDYTVTLAQSLSGPTTTGIGNYLPGAASQQQSVLTQKYTVTNNLGTSSNFGLARFLGTSVSLSSLGTPAVNSPFYGIDNPYYFSFLDTVGQNASLDAGRTLVTTAYNPDFENITFTDLETDNQLSHNFLSLRSFGGSFDGSQSAIRSSGLDFAIAGSNGLLLTGVEGNVTPDTATLAKAATQYTPQFAQQSDFTLPGRQTVEFTTITTFGEGEPIELHNTNVNAPVNVVGNFAFSASSYNYDFSKNVLGNTIPLSIRIDRLSGQSDYLDATDPTNVISTPASVTLSITSTTGQVFAPQTITFAAGQTSASVVIPTPNDLAGTLTLSLSTTTPTAGVVNPGTAIVSVLPTTPTFAFSSTTFTGIEGQGNAAITITRSGNLNGATSVLFSTVTGGTASSADFTAQSNVTVQFADGQSTATVNVPITADTQDAEGDETVFLALGSDPTSATLTIKNADAAAPFVSRLTTVTDGKTITGVQLFFSEALLAIGNVDSFGLFLRNKESASGAAKSKPIDIGSLSYDAATQSVTLTPSKKMAFNKNYQVTLKPDAGLTDLAGNQLNQSPSTNVANYNAIFTRGTKANYVDRTGDIVNLKITNGSFEQVRLSNGDGASISLFGTGASLFSGTIKNKDGGTTSLGTLTNVGGVTISLPPTITAITFTTGTID